LGGKQLFALTGPWTVYAPPWRMKRSLKEAMHDGAGVKVVVKAPMIPAIVAQPQVSRLKAIWVGKREVS